ncbi:primosomal protein N' family DNA-binding protein [Arcanobacterium phocae]|uniref:primosomal protein N' family DNA-binding protein n=1 Tax=Arcanobacterium phocae TaxID=131112 RepID=UPI001C116BA0|nr:hypothetical protein [Arcanobacterium phocae]
MSDLFSLPEYSQQNELLHLECHSVTITSDVPKPVARVVVDSPHVHGDSLFDYEIPEKFADVAVGSRVMVDFGSGRVQGFVVDRTDSTEYVSTLRPLRRVVSPHPVLDPMVYKLAQLVSRRQPSSVSSCLRLAIPQRHARAEKNFLETEYVQSTAVNNKQTYPWDAYTGGLDFLENLRSVHSSQAVIYMRSIDRVIDTIEQPLRTVLSQGQGAIFVVPTAQQAKTYASALARSLGIRVATVLSEQNPEERYRQFLEIKSGVTKLIIGTRSAAWMPVQNLGLVALLDDHHRAHIEPHSPYIHTRDLLALRSSVADCSFLALNYGPSVELAYMTTTHMQAIVPQARRDRSAGPQVLPASSLAYEGEQWSRMPSSVFTVARAGLERGDVAIIVPRTGYIPIIACARCRELATCHVCDGTLTISGPDQPPRCSRCGTLIADFTCRHCHSHRLKPARIGSHRTAHEIGRAFRDTPIHVAGVGESFSPSSAEHRIVISTPGQIPKPEHGYAVGIVLDAGFMLRSESLDAEVHFLRKLAHISTTIQASVAGGQLLVVGDVPASLLLTVKNWDMHGWGIRALREREELSLPPAYVWAQVTGSIDTLRHFLAIVQALAGDAGLASQQQSLAVLLGTGAEELIPGMRIVGPYPGEQDGDRQLYLSFPEHDRSVITEILSRAYRNVSLNKLGRIIIKMDTSV